MKKFFRIIDSEKYGDYIKEEVYRYIPKKLLYIFEKNIKPRVLCNYTEKDTERVVGYGVGIFLDENSIERKEYINRMVYALNLLKKEEMYEDVKYLSIDSLDLNEEEKDFIKANADIDILEGNDILLKKISKLLEIICKNNNRDIREQEILIISDDSNEAKYVMMTISTVAKFLTVYSSNENFTKGLEENILNETGLSLGVIRDIHEKMHTFDFIINLKEYGLPMLERIKKNSIVIDASKNNAFKESYSGRKNRVIITDIFFRNDKKVLADRNGCDFDKFLDSSTSLLLNNTNKDIEKMRIYDKIYSISESIEEHNLRETNMSSFQKI